MERPKLRKVERIELQRESERLTVLVDPLDLCDPLALAAEAGSVLDRFDGRHTLAQIRQSLLLTGDFDVTTEALTELATRLSSEGWLDDDAFRQRWQAIYDGFQQAPTRSPRMGGVLYAADPNDLRRSLEVALPARERWLTGTDVIGVLTPHAPLDVAAPILDATLQRLPPRDEIDVVVVVATDHIPGRLPYAATFKPYDTPLGVVPTAVELVQALVRRQPWLVREELRHRSARSIEIVALILRHLYGDDCPPILPILCGPTALHTGPPDAEVDGFLGSLEAVLPPRVLWWISAELSHAGPAYGDSTETFAHAETRDRDLLQLVARGNAERAALHCLSGPSLRRPSGGATLTTAMRALPVGYAMQLVAYQGLPPPGEQQGMMGLAGARFLNPP